MFRRNLALAVSIGLAAAAPALADNTAKQELDRMPWAETINVYHTPIKPTDGPVARSWLRTMGGAEPAALRKAIPDVRTEQTSERVGNMVIVTGYLIGKLPTGEELRHRSLVAYEIRDGMVVALHTAGDPDPKQRELLAKAYRLGGLVAPPRPAVK